MPQRPGPSPSNRWPWLALGVGVLVLVLAAVAFVVNRRNAVEINVSATPNPLAASSPGPPPTLVPPTPPATASIGVVPTPTAVPTPSPPPSPTPVPASPTPLPSPTRPPVAAVSVPTPAASGAPASVPSLNPAAPPSVSTPVVGQVSNTGGLGNTRADLDAAFGPPLGQTPQGLVVYRKNGTEYHVGFTPDLTGRASLLVGLLPNNQTVPLPAAMAQAHQLIPRDAQPPQPQLEGNDQLIVERYTSASLAQALGAPVFQAANAQPGQFLIVYARQSAQGEQVTRAVIGPGTDPTALLDRGR